MNSYVERIKSSCEYVTNHSKNVSISNDAIQKLADKIVLEYNDKSKMCITTWDEHGWHYTSDSKDNGPLTAQYVFVLDSLNFCFWPCESLEYDTLATRLTKVLEKDSHSFDAERLVQLTNEDITSWFHGYNVPLIEERVLRLHELGYGLLNEFNGLASNVILRANHSCVKLLELLLQFFPGFRDTSLYEGRLIHFYKRAQILAGDIWAAYNRPTDPTHPFYFHDISELTMFADYRVPQILREYNILIYTNELSEKIDKLIELPSNCSDEIEIRALTIIAVERLKTACHIRGLIDVYTIELDWLLWQQGETNRHNIKPHHRVLSVYY